MKQKEADGCFNLTQTQVDASRSGFSNIFIVKKKKKNFKADVSVESQIVLSNRTFRLFHLPQNIFVVADYLSK